MKKSERRRMEYDLHEVRARMILEKGRLTAIKDELSRTEERIIELMKCEQELSPDTNSTDNPSVAEVRHGKEDFDEDEEEFLEGEERWLRSHTF